MTNDIKNAKDNILDPFDDFVKSLGDSANKFYVSIPEGKTPDERTKQKLIGLGEVAVATTAMLSAKTIYKMGMFVDGNLGLGLAMGAGGILTGAGYMGARGSARIVKNSPNTKKVFAFAYNNTKEKLPTFVNKKLKPFVKKSIESATKTAGKIQTQTLGYKTEAYIGDEKVHQTKWQGGILSEMINKFKGKGM